MIIVFGSLNMDLVMSVPSLPRPGETVLCPGYITKPGGKGNNQAVAAARAGAEVMMIGRVGDDEFGRRLVANLRDNGVNSAGVKTSPRPTGIAHICVDPDGENVITVASGANLDAAASQVPDLAPGLGAAIVLMQMEVPPAENWRLIRHARESGARSVLNLAPAAAVPAEALLGLDVLIVNEAEAVAVASTGGLHADGPRALAQRLAEAAQLTCIITLGPQGAIAARPGEAWVVDSMEITPVDTTGAGDAFTGVLAAALDAGLDLPMALRRANVGAALACLALGAQESLPTAVAIDNHLHLVPPPRRLG